MTNEKQIKSLYGDFSLKGLLVASAIVIGAAVIFPCSLLYYVSRAETFSGNYSGNRVLREVIKGSNSQKVWIYGKPTKKWVHVTDEIQDNVTYTPELIARDSDGDGKFEKIETFFHIKGVDRKEVGIVGRYVALDKFLGKEDINDLADDSYKRNIPLQNPLDSFANQKSLEEAVLSAKNKTQ